jgi:hypothetical protein
MPSVRNMTDEWLYWSYTLACIAGAVAEGDQQPSTLHRSKKHGFQRQIARLERDLDALGLTILGLSLESLYRFRIANSNRR